MGFEQPRENKQEENATLSILKKESLGLSGVGIVQREGGKEIIKPDEQRINPNTWNENDGVILFTDGKGEKYVLPDSDEARKTLSEDETMKKDEGIGVPHLQDKEVWGSEERRNSMSSYREWEKLAMKRRDALESQKAKEQEQET